MNPGTVAFGATGGVVAALHQALAECGFPCTVAGELDPPVFGPGTLEAVRYFQSCNVGPDGAHLVPDGVAGPRTWWSLENCGSEQLFRASEVEPSTVGALPDMPVQSASNKVAGAALESAWYERERCVREEPNGSNRGPRVDLYTGFSGRPPAVKGPPWCAYFASWNFSRGPGGSPFGRIGGALAIVEYCQRHFSGAVWDTRHAHLFPEGRQGAWEGDRVAPGDLGIIETGPGHGHVYHVAAVSGGTVWTVEGNSGNAVRTRKREVSSTRWFVNFDRYARDRKL